MTEDDEDVALQAAREDEVENLFPIPADGAFVSGGLDTSCAFYEARLAYVHGLWLSTVFVATAAIERHIGSDLFGAGDNSVVGMLMPDLARKAYERGDIDDFERSRYTELGALRDSYAHFREPIYMVSRMADAGWVGEGFNDLLQADARMALTLAASYFQKNCSM